MAYCAGFTLQKTPRPSREQGSREFESHRLRTKLIKVGPTRRQPHRPRSDTPGMSPKRMTI